MVNAPIELKGLLWEGDGFLLPLQAIKISVDSVGHAPKEEAMEVTPEQYHRLMQGLEIVAKRPIEELTDPPKTM